MTAVTHVSRSVINPTLLNSVAGDSTPVDASAVRLTAQEGRCGQFAFCRYDVIDLCPIVVAVRDP
jgi:hypothetical protein